MRALSHKRFALGVGDDPLVFLKQKLALLSRLLFDASLKRSVCPSDEHDRRPKTVVRNAQGREVQSGLIKLDASSLGNKENFFLPNLERIVFYLSHVSQHEHKGSRGDVKLTALVVLETVVSRVSPHAIASLYAHAAVYRALHALVRDALRLGIACHIHIAA